MGLLQSIDYTLSIGVNVPPVQEELPLFCRTGQGVHDVSVAIPLSRQHWKDGEKIEFFSPHSNKNVC